MKNNLTDSCPHFFRISNMGHSKRKRSYSSSEAEQGKESLRKRHKKNDKKDQSSERKKHRSRSKCLPSKPSSRYRGRKRDYKKSRSTSESSSGSRERKRDSRKRQTKTGESSRSRKRKREHKSRHSSDPRERRQRSRKRSSSSESSSSSRKRKQGSRKKQSSSDSSLNSRPRKHKRRKRHVSQESSSDSREGKYAKEKKMSSNANSDLSQSSSSDSDSLSSSIKNSSLQESANVRSLCERRLAENTETRNLREESHSLINKGQMQSILELTSQRNSDTRVQDPSVRERTPPSVRERTPPRQYARPDQRAASSSGDESDPFKSSKIDVHGYVEHKKQVLKSENLLSLPGTSAVQFPRERDSDTDTDSEDELMFDWESYRYELNRMFFGEEDIIKRGTEEYYDFWKFLKKYHGLQKQKKIREMCDSKDRNTLEQSVSSVYQLPLKYDKRYNINFALNLKDVDDLRRRLPPRDLDEGKKQLSRKKLVEFKFILLLYLDFMQKKRFEKLSKLRKSQASLPIAEYKDEIVSTVKNNTVVIIAGDTGCGKSTQVPQYLLSAGFSNIACTQPRRIACISLSKRVAYETLNEFGSKVGYQIRFEKNKTEHTKIVFLTEGLLLRQVSTDTSLSMYDIIILDEIHERHLHTDFLLGVMKCLIMQRSDIRIVLMSATINIELFRNYFMGKAPVIQVPGRLYPIKLQYFPVPTVEQANKNEKLNPAPYVRILQLIDNKYSDNERGDVLIFLSGMSEISTVVDAAKLYAQQTNRWIVLSLHSTLSVVEQEKVFDVPPEGIRKCIVSTNIAETSVTIDGVRFVVDSGKVKEMSFDSQSKMRKLKEFWISQASAEQRKGRAGRTGPGSCFRLYSEEDYASFSQYSTPEIKRVPLDSLVLQMISMGLPNIRLFPFIEPPSFESLENSIFALKSQAALTDNEGLTTIGELLAQLPMDVSLGKMLIMGSLFHQVEPVLSLAAAMSVQSPFTNRAYRDPECATAIKSLESDHGDPFTLLAAYREWLGIKQEGYEHSRKWCKRRGLEEQRFYEMTKLRHQFAQLLHDSGLQDVAGYSRAHLTSAERAQRIGQLRQLRELKRELHRDGPRKTKVLKLSSQGDGLPSDDDDTQTDIKDVDFRIKNDRKQLGEIYRSCNVQSYKDLIMLKIILCSGLYPNVGIADDHNNYKPGSEQLFHTPSKPFAVLHPNSVFASHPEVLQVADSDIVELPGFSLRHPASPKHQLLLYVSLLETNKPYLVDALRVAAAQMLLMFAHNLDTNADMTVVVCDSFIELKFPDAMSAQNFVFQAVQLRVKWKSLLDLRIKASKPTIENQDRLITQANKLEKDLSVGLVDFFLAETIYSSRRLLDADVKVLHAGPGPGDCILSGNPFSEDGKEPCVPNESKGGVDLTSFLTYNCLLDTECTVTTITSFDTVCPYCDVEFHATTLERLTHMSQCLKGAVTMQMATEEEDKGENDGDPTKKKYFCNVCDKSLWLNIRDIFKHKKFHLDNT